MADNPCTEVQIINPHQRPWTHVGVVGTPFDPLYEPRYTYPIITDDYGPGTKGPDQARSYTARYDEYEAGHHYDPEGITVPEDDGVLTLAKLDRIADAFKSLGNSADWYGKVIRDLLAEYPKSTPRTFTTLKPRSGKTAQIVTNTVRGKHEPIRSKTGFTSDDYINGTFRDDSTSIFDEASLLEKRLHKIDVKAFEENEWERQLTYLRPEHQKGHYRKHSKNKWERT